MLVSKFLEKEAIMHEESRHLKGSMMCSTKKKLKRERKKSVCKVEN